MSSASAERSRPLQRQAGGVELITRSRADLLLDVMILLAILLFVSTLWSIANAPVERQMGIVQKIFYIHVPSAYAMYLGFVACAIGAIGYLWKRNDRFDALSVAGAEVGLLFSLAVLITGPLWARKAWGTFWTWDPRLTTTLLIALIYAAFVVLRSFGGAGESEKRFAAGLAVVGSFLIPIIHESVRRWAGVHPRVITRAGGGLHPDMYPPLFMAFAFFTVLAIVLIWVRARAESARQRVAELETDAAAVGLLEEA